MSTTVKVPDNIPVSWLQQLQELNPDVLMLASQPNDDTETQYMSKYFTYGKLVGQVSTDLSMGTVWWQLSDLYENKASLSDYLTGVVSVNLTDPYIISSMTHIVCSDNRHFGMVSCDGYRLSTGMNTVFTNVNNAGLELTTIIPQLDQKTTVQANPLMQFISSITDKNGHVQSYEYGMFSDVINANIGSATVSVPAGYAVSSVTTDHGLVTEVGAASISGIIGKLSKFYYKDYSVLPTVDTALEQTDLSIMKLTFDQLKDLSSRGGIVQDCLYLTLDDDIDESFHVRFFSFDKLVSSQYVQKNHAASSPAVAPVKWYTNGGWDKDFTNIIGNLDVNAIWTKNVYSMTFDNKGHGVKPADTVYTIDNLPYVPVQPSETGYIFNGWTPASVTSESVEGNVTFNASWSQIVNDTFGEHTLLDLFQNGSTIRSDTYGYAFSDVFQLNLKYKTDKLYDYQFPYSIDSQTDLNTNVNAVLFEVYTKDRARLFGATMCGPWVKKDSSLEVQVGQYNYNRNWFDYDRKNLDGDLSIGYLKYSFCEYDPANPTGGYYFHPYETWANAPANGAVTSQIYNSSTTTHTSSLTNTKQTKILNFLKYTRLKFKFEYARPI